MAKIQRIDSHIIKIIRNYYAKLSQLNSVSLLYTMMSPNQNYIIESLKKGYIPPKAFIYLDSNGMITNINNIPMIYHIPRNRANKKYNVDRSLLEKSSPFKYNTELPDIDICNEYNSNSDKYWWIKTLSLALANNIREQYINKG